MKEPSIQQQHLPTLFDALFRKSEAECGVSEYNSDRASIALFAVIIFLISLFNRMSQRRPAALADAGGKAALALTAFNASSKAEPRSGGCFGMRLSSAQSSFHFLQTELV
jgi:hypothetical protein